MIESPLKIPQIQIKCTDRQRQAFAALDRHDVRRLMYGGAKGGGKSWFLCVWAFQYALRVAREFDLKPSKNPPHIGWIGRKQSVDFAGSTLQTWREWIPEQFYELKTGTEKDPKHILIMGRVAIDYGGLDKQEAINKFNSAEYGFLAVDQAEEITRDDISVAQGSLRLKIKGKELPYKELYTCNPRQCWLRDEFIIEPKPGNVFVPALPKDNPHLPKDYEQTLIDAFGYRPELLRAYLEGDWSVVEGENQVILDSWLTRAMKAPSLFHGKLIACDVARFGDDKTEIMVLEGSQIPYEESMASSRTTEVAGRLAELSRQNQDCPIVADEIGVGGGVIDQLYEWGRNVMAFNGAQKADLEDKYYNRRAEAWWECAEHFSRTELGCSRMSTELRRDLCAPTYEFRNGKILIEPKEDIKERLRRSPDKGDCYVMGIWGLKRMQPLVRGVPAAMAVDDTKSTWDNNVLTRGFKSFNRRKETNV